MKTCCLINHYNYGRFVEEAVASVFAQARPFDEVVLVDDGSTDGSRETIEATAARHDRLRAVFKENEGQLSCFNVGFEASDADLFCFLDADDLYEPEHLSTVVDVFESNPAVDFVYTNRRQLEDRLGDPIEPLDDRDLGYSLVRTLFATNWVGGPTSTLAIRRRTLRKVLPLPFGPDWRTRADDCLVFGTSIAGARKFYVGRPLVRYRVHGDNRYFAKQQQPDENFLRRVAINRLFGHMTRRMGYHDGLEDAAHREFRTVSNPTRAEYRAYRGIVWRSGLPWSRKIGMFASMAAHYHVGTTRG